MFSTLGSRRLHVLLVAKYNYLQVNYLKKRESITKPRVFVFCYKIVGVVAQNSKVVILRNKTVKKKPKRKTLISIGSPNVKKFLPMFSRSCFAEILFQEIKVPQTRRI